MLRREVPEKRARRSIESNQPLRIFHWKQPQRTWSRRVKMARMRSDPES